MQDKGLVFSVLTQGAVAMNLMLKLHLLMSIFYFLRSIELAEEIDEGQNENNTILKQY